MKLVESMFDTVGDISCDAHLRLHSHVSGGSIFRYLIEQLLSSFLISSHIFVVIYQVQGNQSAIEFRITHHNSQTDQPVGIFWIFDGYKNILVILSKHFVGRNIFTAENKSLCGVLSYHRRDDARYQNHNHNGIKHVVGHEILAW